MNNIIIINGTDSIKDSRSIINTNFSNLDTNKAEKNQVEGEILTDTDCNTVITGGRYGLIGTPTNGAIAGEFALDVTNDGTRVMQIATYSTGVMYTRVFNGTTWNSWTTISKADVGLSNVDDTADADKPISTATQTALDGKEPTFTKNTAFNKAFGTTAGTVLEGNTDVSKAGTKTVNETNIADTKMLAYNATSGNLEYIDQPSGGGGGGGIETTKIAGSQAEGTEFFEFIADGAKTVGDVSIALQVVPVGADFIVTWYKNGVSAGTSTILTSATATNDRYRTKTTLSTALVDGDVFTGKITQVGSSVAGGEFSSLVNIS